MGPIPTKNFFGKIGKISRPPLQLQRSNGRYRYVKKFVLNLRSWRGGLEIFRLCRNFFWLVLGPWSSFGQMSTSVTWFRCILGHPTIGSIHLSICMSSLAEHVVLTYTLLQRKRKTWFKGLSYPEMESTVPWGKMPITKAQRPGPWIRWHLHRV